MPESIPPEPADNATGHGPSPAAGASQPATPYIICVDLLDQWVCVVGGGQVAARKVQTLLESGARVHIIAQDLCGLLRDMLADANLSGRLAWQEGPYRRNLPAGARLVVACTDDRAVNRQVRDDCRISNVLCNVVDDPELCDFIVPAVRRFGRVQVAVSTAGAAPSLARELADHLAATVPPGVPDLAQLLAEVRLEVQAQISDTGRRRELYNVLCGGGSLRVLAESGEGGWRQWYQQQLGRYRS